MISRKEKEQLVNELKEKFTKAESAILTDYRGLDVEKISELRKRLREANVEYKVVKNTLARIAAKESGLDFLEEHLVGPTAIAFSYDDPVAPAKILNKFAKEFKILEVKMGLVEGKLMSPTDINALADLPSREVLIAKALAGMQSPISGFVNVLNGPIRGLVYTLKAIQDKKSA
ncbi:MAG TPA: 50S ribosomal protein L10 [Thermoanaerobacterales bacterium]|nr:50S ribosomal protein L10 [Thermoanaerobacterales bacterium]